MEEKEMLQALSNLSAEELELLKKVLKALSVIGMTASDIAALPRIAKEFYPAMENINKNFSLIHADINTLSKRIAELDGKADNKERKITVLEDLTGEAEAFR